MHFLLLHYVLHAPHHFIHLFIILILLTKCINYNFLYNVTLQCYFTMLLYNITLQCYFTMLLYNVSLQCYFRTSLLYFLRLKFRHSLKNFILNPTRSDFQTQHPAVLQQLSQPLWHHSIFGPCTLSRNQIHRSLRFGDRIGPSPQTNKSPH